MTHIQKILIVVGTAILFQLGGALAALSADDMADWRSWLVGLVVGVANAVGVAIVAIRTAGGLAVETKGPGV